MTLSIARRADLWTDRGAAIDDRDTEHSYRDLAARTDEVADRLATAGGPEGDGRGEGEIRDGGAERGDERGKRDDFDGGGQRDGGDDRGDAPGGEPS